MATTFDASFREAVAAVDSGDVPKLSRSGSSFRMRSCFLHHGAVVADHGNHDIRCVSINSLHTHGGLLWVGIRR